MDHNHVWYNPISQAIYLDARQTIIQLNTWRCRNCPAHKTEKIEHCFTAAEWAAGKPVREGVLNGT